MDRKLIGILALLGATLVSCQKSDVQSATPQTQQGAEEPPNTTTELVYANGWDRIELLANFAHTKIYNTGHFETDRNACGKDADGVVDVTTWNRLATLVNQVVTASSATEDQCFTPPDGSKMDGTADLVSATGKKSLFNPNGYDSCTRISDPQLAKQLYDAIDQVVKLADKQDCPNGWGSG